MKLQGKQAIVNGGAGAGAESGQTRAPQAGAVSRRAVLAAGVAGLSILTTARTAFAQSADPIRIGAARAMTGLFTSSFAPIYVGMRIAVDEINASGGMLGRPLEIIEADDESSPAKEPAVMRKLMDGGARAMLGPVGSAHVLAAVPSTTAAKMIHAGGASTEDLANGLKYPYHYQFIYNVLGQGDAVARHCAETLKLKKIGILQENTSFGEAAAGATVRSLKKYGVVPIAIEVYPTNAPDMKVYVGKLRGAGAEAVVLWNSAAQGMVLTAAALQSMRWFPPLLGGNGMFSNAVLESVDPEVLKNAAATLNRAMTYSATEPPGARQVEHAKKVLAYPEAKTWEINAATSAFYDYLHLLRIVVNDEKRFDAELVKKAFDATKNHAGINGKVAFSAQNHCSADPKEVVMVSVLSGKDPKGMRVFRERV